MAHASVKTLPCAPELTSAQLELNELFFENREPLAIGLITIDLHACTFFSVTIEWLGVCHGGDHAEHGDCELLEHFLFRCFPFFN